MPLPTRTCIHCGGLIRLRLIPDKQGVLKLGMDKKYCSTQCKDLYAGGHSKQARSKVARRFIGMKCEVCGTGKDLIVHHIDQDNSNNVSSNIQTLCKIDHDYWHSFAKRVGREIAGRMPALIDMEV